MNNGLKYFRQRSKLLAARTHCKNGHEFTAENTSLRRDGGRRCKACCRAVCAARHRKGNRARLATESEVREFMNHLAHGGTFVDVMKNYSSSMTRRVELSAGIESIKKTLRRSPRLYDRLRKQSKENYLKRLIEVKSPAIVIRSADPIQVMEALRRAVPDAYPERDDIIQQAALAVYEGRTSLAAACRDWKKYRRKHERYFGLMAAASLDAVIGEDGFTLGHIVERGMWDARP